MTDLWFVQLTMELIIVHGIQFMICTTDHGTNNCTWNSFLKTFTGCKFTKFISYESEKFRSNMEYLKFPKQVPEKSWALVIPPPKKSPKVNFFFSILWLWSLFHHYISWNLPFYLLLKIHKILWVSFILIFMYKIKGIIKVLTNWQSIFIIQQYLQTFITICPNNPLLLIKADDIRYCIVSTINILPQEIHNYYFVFSKY